MMIDHVTEPCMEYLSVMMTPLVIVCDALCNLVYPFAGMTNVHEEDMIQVLGERHRKGASAVNGESFRFRMRRWVPFYVCRLVRLTFESTFVFQICPLFFLKKVKLVSANSRILHTIFLIYVRHHETTLFILFTITWSKAMAKMRSAFTCFYKYDHCRWRRSTLLL